MSTHLYLAYGSNMDPERLRSRLGPHLLGDAAAPEAVAVLQNHELRFHKQLLGGGGAADLVGRASGCGSPPAEAVIWRVSERGLSILDGYEGVGAGHYRRERLKVTTTASDELDVMAYLAEPEAIAHGLRPRPAYLQHLLHGARQFLSRDFVEWLAAFETEEVWHA